MKAPTISHQGTIIEINNQNIKVRIVSTSACASCHAKGSCTASESKEKIIEVNTLDSNIYSVGEQVKVTMRKDLGLKAVIYSYLLPFIIMIFTLIIVQNNLNNELISGLSAIGSVIPYYILLYFLQKKLNKSFHFYIEKI